MSNLASLVSTAVRCSIRSQVSGNNVGSTCTSWHASDKSIAVKSLTSLWRVLMNSPFLQDILYWIVNVDPQAHVVGKFAIDYPYRTLILSKTVVLWDQIRFSIIGSINGKFDTPFSRFISFRLFWPLVNDSSKVSKIFLYRSFFSAFILLFSFETSDKLTVYIGPWLMIKFVSSLVIILEFLYSKIAVTWKNGIFNRPYHVGNDNSILSLSEQIWSPVIARMNFCRILCSNVLIH